MTYKAVNPQFSTSLINTCRSCFAPIKSTLALPFRVSWVAISQNIVLPLLNVLMVEVLGTAPKSCTSFNLFHQIVLYLYHLIFKMSSAFLTKNQINYSTDKYNVCTYAPSNVSFKHPFTYRKY